MKTVAALLLSLAGCGAATIGGHEVPSDLHCEEDQAIYFDTTQPAPHPLACVHVDTLGGRG